MLVHVAWFRKEDWFCKTLSMLPFPRSHSLTSSGLCPLSSSPLSSTIPWNGIKIIALKLNWITKQIPLPNVMVLFTVKWKISTYVHRGTSVQSFIHWTGQVNVMRLIQFLKFIIQLLLWLFSCVTSLFYFSYRGWNYLSNGLHSCFIGFAKLKLWGYKYMTD